jgi:hypothetical protein
VTASSYFKSSGRKPATRRAVTVRLSDDQLQRLARVGNDEGLTLSDTVRLVLDRGLAKKKDRR